MPVAVVWYSCGSIAMHHELPVLWMTSCFRVMTDRPSHKNPFTVPLYTLERYMLSSCVCPSVCLLQAGVVSKRLNVSCWFWYGSFLLLCCKEVRVSPKIRVFPSATLSQIFFLDLKNFSRACQSCCQQSSSTVEVVDHTYDGRRVASCTQLTTCPSTAML